MFVGYCMVISTLLPIIVSSAMTLFLVTASEALNISVLIPAELSSMYSYSNNLLAYIVTEISRPPDQSHFYVQ